MRYRLVEVQVQQYQKKEDLSGWRNAIAFLYLFLFHSFLRLPFFFLSCFFLKTKIIKSK